MDLAPLTDYKEPDYPTQEALCAQPETLRKLPRRWRGKPAVMGALAGLLALSSTANRLHADEQPASRVAPIFEHGGSEGTYGCVAVNPPVFLTEAEAREIIESEARKAGIEFSDRSHELQKAGIPVIKPSFPPEPEENQKHLPDFTEGPVKLDGWNSQRRIGYKFISKRGYLEWQNRPIQTKEGQLFMEFSSVTSFRMLEVARQLKTGLEKAGEAGTIAVFYDPLALPPKDLHPEIPKIDNQGLPPQEREARLNAAYKEATATYYRKREEAGKKAGAEELRAQVRDFIAWLKGQGVI